MELQSTNSYFNLKQFFAENQIFATFPDATSHEEVAELAPQRSPSPPAQTAEPAESISPAEERHLSSEDEGKKKI